MLIDFKLTKPPWHYMLAHVSVFTRRGMYVLQYSNATIIFKFIAVLWKKKQQKQLSAPSTFSREFSNSQGRQDWILTVKHRHPVLFSRLFILILHFGTLKGWICKIFKHFHMQIIMKGRGHVRFYLSIVAFIVEFSSFSKAIVSINNWIWI